MDLRKKISDVYLYKDHIMEVYNFFNYHQE